MSTVIAGLAGGLMALGIVAGLVAILGPPQRPERPRVRPQRSLPGWVADRLVLRLALALVALVVVWAATRWPVGALMAAVAAAAGPDLMSARAKRAASLDRIEGIAAWTEQLRDVMAAADGIQTAIAATARAAPPAIGPQVRRLAHRLANRERLEPSLRQFADDVDHPLADMVVTSLLLAAERQGRLGDLLGEVARAARQTAAMRLRVNAVRTRTYVTTRLIIGLTAAMTTWLLVFRRDYLAPFDSAAGQFMLLVIGGIFLASGLGMQRMARPIEPARLLVPDRHGALG